MYYMFFFLLLRETGRYTPHSMNNIRVICSLTVALSFTASLGR